ncbi:hypothetical protein BLNAU_15461 [Blattamonas nauphoetae]|uniref:Transmembrane protein n=1 Tax=Blattamonas nauphoetae TaxID=2049346 RepID=A0ABQ9XH31_9EUKA|nr:hypothetical protein BLNAU_15461 [Blattamonas nauphoetae]
MFIDVDTAQDRRSGRFSHLLTIFSVLLLFFIAIFIIVSTILGKFSQHLSLFWAFIFLSLAITPFLSLLPLKKCIPPTKQHWIILLRMSSSRVSTIFLAYYFVVMILQTSFDHDSEVGITVIQVLNVATAAFSILTCVNQVFLSLFLHEFYGTHLHNQSVILSGLLIIAYLITIIGFEILLQPHASFLFTVHFMQNHQNAFLIILQILILVACFLIALLLFYRVTRDRQTSLDLRLTIIVTSILISTVFIYSFVVLLINVFKGYEMTSLPFSKSNVPISLPNSSDGVSRNVLFSRFFFVTDFGLVFGGCTLLFLAINALCNVPPADIDSDFESSSTRIHNPDTESLLDSSNEGESDDETTAPTSFQALQRSLPPPTRRGTTTRRWWQFGRRCKKTPRINPQQSPLPLVRPPSSLPFVPLPHFPSLENVNPNLDKKKKRVRKSKDQEIPGSYGQYSIEEMYTQPDLVEPYEEEEEEEEEEENESEYESETEEIPATGPDYDVDAFDI